MSTNENKEPTSVVGVKPIPALCKTKDVVRLLGLSPRTVQAMAQRGELVAKKVGRGWRFDTKALLEKVGINYFELGGIRLEVMGSGGVDAN